MCEGDKGCTGSKSTPTALDERQIVADANFREHGKIESGLNEGSNASRAGLSNKETAEQLGLQLCKDWIDKRLNRHQATLGSLDMCGPHHRYLRVQ